MFFSAPFLTLHVVGMLVSTRLTKLRELVPPNMGQECGSVLLSFAFSVGAAARAEDRSAVGGCATRTQTTTAKTTPTIAISSNAEADFMASVPFLPLVRSATHLRRDAN